MQFLQMYTNINVVNSATEIDINLRLLAFSKALKNSDVGYTGLPVFVSNRYVLKLSGGIAIL